MKLIIFYSWQSKYPRVNRDLIQEAAILATQRISTDDTLEVDPALDRDTKGVPGSPTIAESIFSKIQQCELFLCDVTIIGEAEQRPTPNPNVLIELGYAVAKVGWDRIICVMNEAYGGPTKLPFDLQHRRWPIRYRLTDKQFDPEKFAQIREKLSEEIELAIRTAIQSGIIPRRLNAKDVRLASKLEGIVKAFSLSTLTAMANTYGLNFASYNGSSDWSDKVMDTVISNVEFIIELLQYRRLVEESTSVSEGKTLLWYQVLYTDLKRLEESCDNLLNRHYERDDQLISVIEELQQVSKLFGGNMIAIGMHQGLGINRITTPEIEKSRVIEFIATLQKAYRIARAFQA